MIESPENIPNIVRQKEQGDDEILWGFVDEATGSLNEYSRTENPLKSIPFLDQDKRIGVTAYTSDGKKIIPLKQPVFVKRSALPTRLEELKAHLAESWDLNEKTKMQKEIGQIEDLLAE